MLRKTLTGKAADWWHSAKHNIRDWFEFERQFRNTFWNSEVRARLKKDLFNTKYQDNMSMSRVQFCNKKFALANDLNVPESDTIIQLKDVFEVEVQQQVRANCSKEEFLEILTRFDSIKPKKNNPGENSNNSNNFNNSNRFRNQSFNANRNNNFRCYFQPDYNNNNNQKKFQPDFWSI